MIWYMYVCSPTLLVYAESQTFLIGVPLECGKLTESSLLDLKMCWQGFVLTFSRKIKARPGQYPTFSPMVLDILKINKVPGLVGRNPISKIG